MRMWVCKCGKSQIIGSDGPRPCQGCPECGTTYEGISQNWKTPEPHDPIIEETRTTYHGKTKIERKVYCAQCYEKLEPRKVWDEDGTS